MLRVRMAMMGMRMTMRRMIIIQLIKKTAQVNHNQPMPLKFSTSPPVITTLVTRLERKYKITNTKKTAPVYKI